MEHFNAPQTKFIGDSLYKHPVLKLRAHNKPETSLLETARLDDFHVRSVSEDDMFVACHCRDKTFMV